MNESDATPITPSPHHPSSTYRVQLSAGFTFHDARDIVPYLADLGIGALYSSPFLRAIPGSTHGYDVTDYSGINPEIGSEEELRALADALRSRGLGHIVDMVPNHMGIAQSANAWWQDVLENGRTSPYAGHFDIDWRPLKEELRGKILLPVLGDHYGVVLERGELQLEFADGAFSVRYFETCLPIAPPTYPMILTMALNSLPSPGSTGEGLGVRANAPEDDPYLLEFQSIITAFERLPPQDECDPDLIAERRREQTIAKRRLADLVTASPEVARALEETVRAINGDPADPSTLDTLDRLLDAQSYRLSSFRTAGEEINYRRFFAINELAAVRQEAPEVFAAAHDLLLRLLAEGVVTGFRIDHPDGLWDPAGYFRELQRAAWRALHQEVSEEDATEETEPIDWNAVDPAFAGEWKGQTGDGAALGERLPVYVIAEKILEPGEVLPNDWAIHGTVGYEFARQTTGLFVDPAHRRAFDELYTRFTGELQRRPFAAIAFAAKELMLRTALASETTVLARALNRISEQNRRTRDFTLSALRHALREVIASFPVYRSYVACGLPSPPTATHSAGTRPVEPGEGAFLPSPRSERRKVGDEGESSPISDHDRRAIERAVALAKRRNPASDLTVFDFLGDVLLLRDDGTLSETERAERCQFVMKFQQLTGPVMAKGVEDTAFYVYNRLIALNEVGGDPAVFGTSVAEFHRGNAERARRWPYAMLTSSTHDTKRSEDVRARIAVLSEMPREWRAAVNRWARLNRRHKTRVEGSPAPDRNDEYLFYQTLLGVWPWGVAAPDENLIERIAAFMIKAARESQVHTTWVNPDAAYEDALRDFVRATLDLSGENPFLEDMAKPREVVAHIGAINALAQQLLKIAAPGVPDIYQGTELWDQSLVDPDNRRPVGYALRTRLLRGLRRRRSSRAFARELLAAKEDGRIKLYLTWKALAFRAAHPDLFTRGEYVPLAAEGSAADHVVAFARRDDEKEVIVVVPRLVAGLTGGGALDPIGPDVWGKTRLILTGAEPGARYRDLFTGETIERAAGEGDAVLPLAEVFAALPFALLDRVG